MQINAMTFSFESQDMVNNLISDRWLMFRNLAGPVLSVGRDAA